MNAVARIARIVVAAALALVLAQAMGLTPGTGGAFDPALLPAACTAFRNCGTLDVAITGSGSGTITDDQGQIDCTYVAGGSFTGTCAGEYDWPSTQTTTFQVVLTVAPATGSYGCLTGSYCKAENQTFESHFALKPNDHLAYSFEFDTAYHQLVVGLGGTGSGTIGSAQFTCQTYPCDSGTFPSGTTLGLEAIAAPGSTFVGWTGACATQPAQCQVQLWADSTTTAVFNSTTGPTPTPTHAGATQPPHSSQATGGGSAGSPPATVGPAGSSGLSSAEPSAAQAASLAPVSSTGGGGGSPSPAGSTGPQPVALLLIGAAVLLVLIAGGLFVRSRPKA